LAEQEVGKLDGKLIGRSLHVRAGNGGRTARRRKKHTETPSKIKKKSGLFNNRWGETGDLGGGRGKRAKNRRVRGVGGKAKVIRGPDGRGGMGGGGWLKGDRTKKKPFRESRMSQIGGGGGGGVAERRTLNHIQLNGVFKGTKSTNWQPLQIKGATTNFRTGGRRKEMSGTSGTENFRGSNRSI